MANILDSLKRQIEILAFFFVKSDEKIFTSDDLADKYNVSKITIDRDLNYLRSLGIPINSTHKKGIIFTGKVNDKIISTLIVKYFAIYNSEFILSRAFDFVRIKGMNALHLISTINNCISGNTFSMINIDSPNLGKRSLKIIPYKIVDDNSNLDLIFIHNNTADSIGLQFIVSANDLRELNTIDYKNKVKDYFDAKYRSLPSTLKIKLQVSSNHTFKNFEINDIQVIQSDVNGTVEIETRKSSLEDIAIWAMKQSGSVKILEPIALIKKIREMSENAIQASEQEPKFGYTEYVAESRNDSFCRFPNIDVLFSPASEWNIESPKSNLTTIGTIELSITPELYF